MTLKTLSDTYLQIASGWIPGRTSEEYFPLKDDHVDQHQEEMVDALCRREPCVLNANPTGGGKTLSWAAPVIRRDLVGAPDLVMATYPTAALLEDQRETLLKYLKTYFQSNQFPATRGRAFELQDDSSGSASILTDGRTSFALDDLVQTISVTFDPSTPTHKQVEKARSSLASLERAGLPGIVLTTPDTLTLLATGRFHSKDANRLVPLLDAIVIDEFHLSTDRARRLLPFHLHHYRSLSSRYLETFVFLSATPSPSYVDRIKRVFDPYRVTNQVLSKSRPSARQILPETHLHITSRNRFTNGRWLADNVDVLESTYEPPGQLLVIVDSVREVEIVTEAIQANTELSVGRVYGWKREGRQEAIENSQIVVGNTAVEVGVDFKNINRLVCTGYEPASILQRLGRMRYRTHLDDYKALLITSPSVQHSLVTRSSGKRLTRSELDQALHAPAETTERPYYDVLCGVYSRYLWERADKPLYRMYVDREDEFRNIAAEHFASNVDEFFSTTNSSIEFWEFAGKFLDSELTEALFEELHGYRPSSLSCVVVDSNDRQERLKMYSLSHVLRHREGKVFELNDVQEVYQEVWNEPLTPTEQAMLDRSIEYAVAGFLSTGRRSVPRDYYLYDYAGFEILEQLAAENPSRAIQTLPNPAIKTDPPVTGINKIDLSDEDVLVQYVSEDPTTARERYALGPYAAVVPTPREGSLLMWDDAIKAHCQLVERSMENM